MDLILKCCNKWNSGPCKKCLKFSRTTIALAICLAHTAVLFIVLFIAIFSPATILDFYTFGRKYNNLLLYGYITATAIMLTSSLVLFFGLKAEKTGLLFTWIVIMTTFWNIHLAVGIVSIVNFIVDGEEQQLAKTPVRSVVLIIVQVVWLLGIALIWFHWRTLMKLSDDTPNLVEFIRERSSLSSASSGEATEQKLQQPKGQGKEQGQEQTTSQKRIEQPKEQRQEQEQRKEQKRTEQPKEQKREQSKEQKKEQSKEQGKEEDQGQASSGESSDQPKELKKDKAQEQIMKRLAPKKSVNEENNNSIHTDWLCC